MMPAAPATPLYEPPTKTGRARSGCRSAIGVAAGSVRTLFAPLSACLVAGALTIATARADDAPVVRHSDAAAAARDGDFLPGAMPARIGDRYVMGQAFGGYDSSPNRGGAVAGVIEGALANRVALRVAVDLFAGGATWSSLAAGLRIALLRQERFGVDLSLYGGYRSVGLTEASGAIEFGVLVGRRFGRFQMIGNFIYGQGVDLNTRNGEVRVALLYTIGERWTVGLDSRCRFDIASQISEDALSSLGNGGRELDFDAFAGPIAAVAVGPVAFIAQAGARALVFEGHTLNVGGGGLAGIGAAF